MSSRKLCQNVYNIFYFCLAIAMLQILGHVIHHWKGVFKTFPTVYYKPPKFLNFQLVKPKKIHSRSASAEQAGQKNRNGKTIAVLFRNVFYARIKGKSGIFLLLAMSIGSDWMVDLMIIYIGKTSAKAFDIDDIIKKIMGMSAR
jgi:hypothetical protein